MTPNAELYNRAHLGTNLGMISCLYSVFIVLADTAAAIVRLASIGIIVLGTLGVLRAFDLTAASIGVASVGGLAFSLASKSLVENTLAGVSLVLRNPFKVRLFVT